MGLMANNVSLGDDRDVTIAIERTDQRKASSLRMVGLVRSPSRSRLDSIAANHTERSPSHSGKGQMPMAVTKAVPWIASW